MTMEDDCQPLLCEYARSLSVRSEIWKNNYYGQSQAVEVSGRRLSVTVWKVHAWSRSDKWRWKKIVSDTSKDDACMLMQWQVKVKEGPQWQFGSMVSVTSEAGRGLLGKDKACQWQLSEHGLRFPVTCVTEDCQWACRWVWTKCSSNN